MTQYAKQSAEYVIPGIQSVKNSPSVFHYTHNASLDILQLQNVKFHRTFAARQGL